MSGLEAEKPVVGVVGFGRMGSAIAARLAAEGLAVHGWTRSGLAVERAATLGVTPSPDLATLLGSSEFVVLSLLDDAAVRDVIGEASRFDLTGKLLVETSTVSPDTLRALMPAINAAGGSAIDAPIAGGPPQVAAGEVGLYVGGDEDDVAAFMPVAQHLSGRIVHVGGVGAGAAAKIVNNMLMISAWQGLKEAFLLGRQSGLDLETMLGFLVGSPAINSAIAQRAPVIRGETDQVGFSVSGVVKDARVFLAHAAQLGVETPALTAAAQSFADYNDSGAGEADLGTMVRAAYLKDAGSDGT